MASTGTTSAGMGLVGWLTVLFVGLKLTGFIEWSWVWVLSPLWISWSVFAIIILILLVAQVSSERL